MQWKLCFAQRLNRQGGCYITPPGKDNPVPVAKIGNKVLGVIDKSDRQKLQAAKLLRPGASIRCELQSNPATTAILGIDKESLRYPTTWIKQSDASKQAWIQENMETPSIPVADSDKPYERPTWEQHLVKAALKTLNTIQPDALGRRITGMGAYIAVYTENSLERSLRVFDGMGDRGILYKAQQGERPSIDNFTHQEKQEFASLISQSKAEELLC